MHCINTRFTYLLSFSLSAGLVTEAGTLVLRDRCTGGADVRSQYFTHNMITNVCTTCKVKVLNVPL